MRSTLLVAVALTTLAGCASVGNFAGEEGCRVYGGTRTDASLISDCWGGESEIAKSQAIAGPVRLAGGCCGLVDLPFSMIADTVTLPITVPLALGRHDDESTADAQAKKGDRPSSSAK
jgi:uncharacterized protein YceK